MIFVDTSAWFAAMVPADNNHSAATLWLDLNTQPLITTDYVVSETLTLLRARREAARALTLGRQFFEAPVATIHYLTAAEVLETWQVFHQFADKAWSFTDCASKVVMENLGLNDAFAFDQHFHQFGSVAVVP